MKKLIIFFSLMVSHWYSCPAATMTNQTFSLTKKAIVGAWEITEVQGTPEWWWITSRHCAQVQFQRLLHNWILHGRLL